MRFSGLHWMAVAASVLLAVGGSSSTSAQAPPPGGGPQADSPANSPADGEAEEVSWESLTGTDAESPPGPQPPPPATVPEPAPDAGRSSTSPRPTRAWTVRGPGAAPLEIQGELEPEPEPEPEPRENPLLTSRLILSMAFFTGPAQEGDLDAALANLGYSPDDAFWGLDLTVEARVSKLFFLGVRADTRVRQWTMWGGRSADAVGPALLAVADLRLTASRWFDFSGVLGAGFGAAVLRVRDSNQVAGLPRMHAGLAIGLTLVDGFRIHAGAAFDYAESLPMNEFDHSVSFSIVAFRFGFEARL